MDIIPRLNQNGIVIYVRDVPEVRTEITRLISEPLLFPGHLDNAEQFPLKVCNAVILLPDRGVLVQVLDAGNTALQSSVLGQCLLNDGVLRIEARLMRLDGGCVKPELGCIFLGQEEGREVDPMPRRNAGVNVIPRLNQNARFVRSVDGNEEDVPEVDFLSSGGGGQATDFQPEGVNAGTVRAASGRGRLPELLKSLDPTFQTRILGNSRLVDDGSAADESDRCGHQGRKEEILLLHGHCG